MNKCLNCNLNVPVAHTNCGVCQMEVRVALTNELPAGHTNRRDALDNAINWIVDPNARPVELTDLKVLEGLVHGAQRKLGSIHGTDPRVVTTP